MESDEKLRQEIMHLSDLIASSSSTTSPTFSLTRTNNSRIHQFHPSFSQSHTVTNGHVQAKSFKVVKYPNPFDRHCNDKYLSQIFPSPVDTDRSTTETQNGHSHKMSRGSQFATTSKCIQATLKFKDSKTNDEKYGTNDTARTPSLNVREKSTQEILGTTSVETKAKPTSVFINPSYLAQINSGKSVVGSSFPSCVVRPHINPAHSAFQIITANNSNSSQLHNLVVAAPSSCKSNATFNYGYAAVQTNESSSTNNCDKELKMRLADANINESTLRTQYKLDRRIKPSPLRKTAKSKIMTTNTTAKTKLFKRYSMRVVPDKLTPDVWLSTTIKKSLALNTKRHLNKKLAHTFIKSPPVYTSQNVSKLAVKRASKSIIHIDGDKFVSRNKGKTLKRMSSKENVVSINGNRFIQKNSGKSLKRLSESSPSDKIKPSHSQQQTTVRLANRAIQRSKLALSQRTWKKKQLCVFYNRFGECKRNSTGSCPYIHDRKQLMICPKFLVGSCTVSDCKLSHDQKVGRMPPCQFFNKSECSREHCPYPHIKASPLVKKSSETVQRKQDKVKTINTEGKQGSRKKKLSPKKESTSPRIRKTIKKKKEIEAKARYYEQCPDSQPIVSIIPRRLPKDPKDEEIVDKVTIKESDVYSGIESCSDNASVSGNSMCDAAAGEILESRRMRLMSKISRLHEKVKKKESTAPQFLPFN